MLKQIIKTKDRVKDLLTDSKDLRDNDNRLIAIFWAYELGVDTMKQMSANDFLANLANGKLTKPESIRRARQKIQEENENLRGTSYKARKQASETVRKGI